MTDKVYVWRCASDFVLDTVRRFYAGGDETALAARYRFPFPVLAPSFEATIVDEAQFIEDADRLREVIRSLGITRIEPVLVSSFSLSRRTTAVQISRVRLRADGSEHGADFSVYTAERLAEGWVMTSLAISDREWPADCDSFDHLFQRPTKLAALHASSERRRT